MMLFAKNTVENIKGSMKGEMSKMDKIGVKYASMTEILDELSSKERDFEKFIRVIMRQPGMHKNDTARLGRSLSPSQQSRIDAKHGSQASIMNSSQPSANNSRIKRKPSITKIMSNHLNHMSEEAKSGQFTLQPTKNLDHLTLDSEETTISIAKFPALARMSFEEREQY